MAIHTESMYPDVAPVLTRNAYRDHFAFHSISTQILILAGQSSIPDHSKVITFELIGMDPATKPMLAGILGADLFGAQRPSPGPIDCGAVQSSSAKANVQPGQASAASANPTLTK